MNTPMTRQLSNRSRLPYSTRWMGTGGTRPSRTRTFGRQKAAHRQLRETSANRTSSASAARTMPCVRVRRGKASIPDGPFAESKELVAGFYLIDARDLSEAVQVAARIPSAPLGTVEVRATRQLIVEGRQP